MAEESFQERTEQATPKKKEEARKRGSVAQSIEINSAIVLLSGVLAMTAVSHLWFGGLARELRFYFGNAGQISYSADTISSVLARPLLQTALLLAPVIAALLLAGVAASIGQVGFLFTVEPLAPKLDRISPIQGFKRLFSARALVELLKGILKVGLVSYVAYRILRGEREHMLLLSGESPGQVLSYIGAISVKVALRVSLLLLAMALADYGYQRFEHERSLRMTKQEVKEELKQTEGDPLVKSRIRSIQRAIARQRMMKEVPKADVVITNPTELAVALKYDPGKMNAPVVVAKGARKLAARIKEIAREHGVPIVENKPLARLLYKTADVGMEIPAEAYQAVAEVLAYVYRLRGKVI